MRNPEQSGPRVELRMTGDGSHTLYVPDLREHYHSIHGAVDESRHIYIGCGLLHAAASKSTVEILEIGFGTGLNALLTCIESSRSPICVRYSSLEKFPLPAGVLAGLNYPEVLDFPDSFIFYSKILNASWDEEFRVHDSFFLHKISGGIESTELPAAQFDLIYFDAFGPEVQPEMWTEAVFRKLNHSLHEGGVLVTYSAKGDVKRALRSAGFSVKKLPGPTGKREIVRATKERSMING